MPEHFRNDRCSVVLGNEYRADFTVNASREFNAQIIKGINNTCDHYDCLLIACDGVVTTGDGELWIKNELVDYSALSEDAKNIVDAINPRLNKITQK